MVIQITSVTVGEISIKGHSPAVVGTCSICVRGKILENSGMSKTAKVGTVLHFQNGDLYRSQTYTSNLQSNYGPWDGQKMGILCVCQKKKKREGEEDWGL